MIVPGWIGRLVSTDRIWRCGLVATLFMAMLHTAPAPVAAQSASDMLRMFNNLQRSAPQYRAPRQRAPARHNREAVYRAQTMLNALGYDAGPEDGAMGPRTRNALTAFQRDVGLRRTGVVNRSTLSELERVLQSRSAARSRVTSTSAPGTPPAAGATPHDGTYEATSRTAIAITGDIVIAAGRITFANGASIGLRSVGAHLPGVFAVDPPVDPILNQGNRMCGPATPRFVVLAQDSPNNLYLKVFDGPDVPAPSTSVIPQPGMCGLYNFARRQEQTRQAQAAPAQPGARLLSSPVEVETPDRRRWRAGYRPRGLARVQELLGFLGYDAGTPDGIMGPRTREALADFQADHGLSPTGSLDQGTVLALQRTGQSDPGERAVAQVPQQPQQPQPSMPSLMPPRGTVADSAAPASPPAPSTDPVAALAHNARPAEVPSFETASAPDHNTLLGLYMAANADILDNDAFAWEHYLVRHIKPGANRRRSDECSALFMAMQNQFEREDRMRQARALAQEALRRAEGAATTHVFKIKDTVRLSEYDHEQESFELKSASLPHLFGGEVRIARDAYQRIGGYKGAVTDYCAVRWEASGAGFRYLPGAEVMPRVGFLASVHAAFGLSITPDDRLTSLPMSAAQARDYLDSLPSIRGYRPDTNVVLETLIEVGPAAFTAENSGMVPATIIAARAVHPETGAVIHTFDLAPTEVEVAADDSPLSEDRYPAMTDYRLSFLMLRDQPQLLSDERVMELTRRQIAGEQACYGALERYVAEGGNRLQLNPNLPTITRSWQSTGPGTGDPMAATLLDVFLSPEADWTFASQTPGYDERFNHLIDAFVFDADDIRDRNPEFLAPEIASVFRSHLAAAITSGRAPERLHTVYPLPGVGYDREAGALRFNGSRNEFLDRVDLLPGAGADEGSFLYNPFAHGYRKPDESFQKPGLGYRCTSPTERWRELMAAVVRPGSSRSMVRPVLAFGHELSIASISQTAAEAERLIQQLDYQRKGLLARVSFHVEQVSMSGQEGRPTTFFHSNLESVEIITPDGSVLARLEPSDFRTVEGIAEAVAERDRLRAPPIERIVERAAPDAETLDLLKVKLKPEALTDSMLERMILSRWSYEEQVGRLGGARTWGDFFLRTGEEGLLILDRPDPARLGDLAPLFRQWTIERAETVSRDLVFRFPVNKLEPGFLHYPSAVGIDQRNALNSDIASCRRARTSMGTPSQRQERRCAWMEAARDIPPTAIEFTRAMAPGIGPRSACGTALGTRDFYCEGASSALEELVARGARLLDVFVADKVVHITETDRAESAGNMIELVARVEAVEIAEELPQHPLFVATGRQRSIPSHQRSMPTGTQTVHHWRLTALSARLLDDKTGATIRDLDLVEPPPLNEPADDAAPAVAELAASGPDILGIQIGMSFDEAERLINEHMDVGRVLTADRSRDVGIATGKISPFTSGRVYVSADATDLIVLYDEPPAAEGIIVGAARQVLLPKGQVTPLAVLNSLRNKYGPEDTIMYGMMSTDLLVWGDASGYDQDGWLFQDCLPGRTRHNRQAEIWREQDGEAPDWGEDHLRANTGFPILEPLNFRYDNPGHQQDCPRAVAGLFEPAREREQWDALYVWLSDLGAYIPLIQESARLLQSGTPLGAGDQPSTEPPSIDVRL